MARAIIQGTVKQHIAQSSSKALGIGKFDLSSINEIIIRSKKWEKSMKKTKKDKFWSRLKKSLSMGSGSSFGSNNSGCIRYGKPHKWSYRFRTTSCYKCG